MNILIGVFLIALGITVVFGLGYTSLAMFRLDDHPVSRVLSATLGISVCILGLVLVLFGFWMVMGWEDKPPLVIGRCYQAVSETTTTVIPVGKVFIPTTTKHVSLLEIECP